LVDSCYQKNRLRPRDYPRSKASLLGAVIRQGFVGACMQETTKTVIVGQSKPLLNYVTACITMFNSGAEHVVLRSRGEAINMAVEVAQVLKKRFVSQMQISKIQIDGENVVSRDGRSLNLPVLEIELFIPKAQTQPI
jgi:archaea-specific DNA-binding protein